MVLSYVHLGRMDNRHTMSSTMCSTPYYHWLHVKLVHSLNGVDMQLDHKSLNILPTFRLDASGSPHSSQISHLLPYPSHLLQQCAVSSHFYQYQQSLLQYFLLLISIYCRKMAITFYEFREPLDALRFIGTIIAIGLFTYS